MAPTFFSLRILSISLLAAMGVASMSSSWAAERFDYKALVRELRVTSPVTQVALQSSQASLDFGTKPVGSSSSLSVTLTNPGTAATTFTQVPAISGEGFSVTGSTCTASLPPGGSCTLQVSYSPSAPNSANAALTYATSAGAGTVALSGVATASESLHLQFDGASGTTGIVDSAGNAVNNVGVSHSTATYTAGTASGTFASGSRLSVGAPSKFSFENRVPFTAEVWIKPTSTGTPQGLMGNYQFFGQTGWRLVLNQAGGVQFLQADGVAYRGAETSARPITANTWHHVAAAGDGTTVRVFIDGKLELSTPQEPNLRSTGLFYVGINPDQSAGITWPFVGQMDELRVVKGQALYTSAFTPTPSGPPMAMVSASVLAFPTMLVGANADLSVRLTNTGTSAMHLSSPSLSGASAFSFPATGGTSCGTTLAVNAYCDTTVRFAPTAQGSVSGLLTFTTDSVVGAATVSLTGSGGQPVGALTGSGDFATVTAGGTSSKTLTFANTGTMPAMGTYATLSGTGFSLSGNSCGSSAAPVNIEAGGACSMTVVFSPSATGTFTGALSVQSSATNAPSSLTLTGQGYLPTTGDGISKVGACASGAAAGCTTWNSATAYGVTLSADLLTATATVDWNRVHAFGCKTTGKWYVEMRQNGAPWPGSGFTTVGLSRTGVYPTYGLPEVYASVANGTWAGIAVDLDARQVTFLGPLSGTTTTTALPSSGALCLAMGYNHKSGITLNAGQSNFTRVVPSGFNAGWW